MEKEVLRIVAKICKLSVDELTLDTQLFKSNIISSLGLLELIDELERQFKIMILPEELVNENFSTIKQVIFFVQSKLGD